MNQTGTALLGVPSARRVATYICLAARSAVATSGASGIGEAHSTAPARPACEPSLDDEVSPAASCRGSRGFSGGRGALRRVRGRGERRRRAPSLAQREAGGERQGHGEAGALAHLARDPHRAPEDVEQPAREVEPEADAAPA